MIFANTRQEEYQLMIPRTGHISDVLEALQKKAHISDEVMEKVRIYEVHNSKFYKDLNLDYGIMGVGEYFTLYAAAFPEEDSDKKITVFHFDREPSKVHGIPFQFPLKEVCYVLATRSMRQKLRKRRARYLVKRKNVSRISPKSKGSLSTRSSSL